MAIATAKPSIITRNSDIGLAIGILLILGVMVLPVPAVFLDILLATSITAGLIILMVAIYLKNPVDFSVFPSLLLIVTVFRLGLNVATTRRILLHGNEGADAAGSVIEAFGQFVVGGNYAVGIVVFTILVIINFKVITQGSTRTAEVAARFTLDAMPGKQMSIDADLNAGSITDIEAKTRRKQLEDEASFYGAMDGALKFVRGDVVAGIIITIVNIAAGFAIGTLQQGMPLAEAAEIYTILTIGDGLVSQLPSLIISISAGIIVTRAVGANNLGQEIAEQLMINPRAFAITSGSLLFLAMVPGMPGMAFAVLGALAGGLSYMMFQAEEVTKSEEERRKEDEAEKPAPEKVEALLPLDTLELEIGYELIPMVDAAQDGELLDRIKSIRRQFALEMGIIVPPMHIRDNLQLKSNEYSILIKGVEVAKGELWMNHHLAIDPGTGVEKVPGVETTEPTFGLRAFWMTEANKEKARSAGYTVVDTATVITTHIKEIIKQYAHELLGRQESQGLIDSFKETNPKVIEELIPGLLTLGQTQKVLQNLLKEYISIRDLQTILETLADHAPVTKDTDTLTEYVRAALSRSISKQMRHEDGTIKVITLDPGLEKTVADSVKMTEHGSYLALDPSLAQKIIDNIKEQIGKFSSLSANPVLLTGPQVRMHLRRLTERFVPNLSVLSHSEVTPDTQIDNIAVVAV
ncbi:Flagellar biosynthesis protein FlhA [hydrothermal vent metagenome]|uniref:Flagellar biosynthesis protein FlhA n=1 Tax=hydrothermal vent metagenome TaxID=652676 RepID=A0A3B1BGH3_9ZZZZ